MTTEAKSSHYLRQCLLTIEQLKFICRVLFILDCTYDDLLSSSIEDLMVALGLHEDLILINEQQINAALENYIANNSASEASSSKKTECYPILLSNNTWRDICLRIEHCADRYQRYSDQYQREFINRLLNTIK
jgi:hypothetical protein